MKLLCENVLSFFIVNHFCGLSRFLKKSLFLFEYPPGINVAVRSLQKFSSPKIIGSYLVRETNGKAKQCARNK